MGTGRYGKVRDIFQHVWKYGWTPSITTFGLRFVDGAYLNRVIFFIRIHIATNGAHNQKEKNPKPYAQHYVPLVPSVQNVLLGTRNNPKNGHSGQKTPFLTAFSDYNENGIQVDHKNRNGWYVSRSGLWIYIAVPYVRIPVWDAWYVKIRMSYELYDWFGMLSKRLESVNYVLVLCFGLQFRLCDTYVKVICTLRPMRRLLLIRTQRSATH